MHYSVAINSAVLVHIHILVSLATTMEISTLSLPLGEETKCVGRRNRGVNEEKTNIEYDQKRVPSAVHGFK